MEKFTFGILGAGKIAVKFTEAARLAGAEVAAVASKSAARASEFAKANGVSRSFGDYAAMLDEVKPDCAYIATTPDSHCRLAMLCASRKIPVLCEKAMFVNSAEAESAMALAGASSVFMMEALWSRFLPANARAKQWLGSGAIGDVCMCDVAIGFCAPDGDGNRYWAKSLGGGAARDVTVYAYELARYYLDGDASGASVNVRRAPTGVDASETVTMALGGVPVTLRTSFETNLGDRAVLYGTKGRIEIPHPHFANAAQLYGLDGALLESFTDDATKNGFVYELEEVMRRVRAGETESPVVPWSLTLSCAKLFDLIDAQ